MDDIVDLVSRSDDDLRALIASSRPKSATSRGGGASCTASSTSCAPSS